jgi:hypothetical protein
MNGPLIGVAIGLVIMGLGMWRDKSLAAGFGVVVVVLSAITYCETTPEAEAKRRATAEAERRARIPHVIREADGCKVYAFTAGSKEHYFTRCAGMVTTDRNYEVKKSCGKNCTKTEQHTETIVTKD